MESDEWEISPSVQVCQALPCRLEVGEGREAVVLQINFKYIVLQQFGQCIIAQCNLIVKPLVIISGRHMRIMLSFWHTISPLDPPIPGRPGGPWWCNTVECVYIVEQYCIRVGLFGIKSPDRRFMSFPLMPVPFMHFQLAESWVDCIDFQVLCMSPGSSCVQVYWRPRPNGSNQDQRTKPNTANTRWHNTSTTLACQWLKYPLFLYLCLAFNAIYVTWYALQTNKVFWRFHRMRCGSLAGCGKRLFVSH